MIRKRRIHDGIAGDALGPDRSASWRLVPAVLGVPRLHGRFIGFRPVRYVPDNPRLQD